MLINSAGIPPEILNLRESGSSLMIYCRDGSIITKKSRGVIDLMRLYESDERFRDAVIADKVVGKGAAAMIVALGFRRCITPVASVAAIELLHHYDVEIVALETVDHIINHSGTGRCPVETLLEDIPADYLYTMIERIKEFINSIGK